MSNPKFAETHNLVAFLEKPEESDGFKEIIDFLNASSAKTVNRERQIQALVDKKKVIISEMSIRSDLKLDDAEGTYCIPTAIIFAELERMGLQEKVLDLEKAKTAQAKEIASVKKRVKVESSNDAILGAQEDASKHGRKIADLDADAEEVSTADPITTAGEGVTTANVEVTTASAPTTTIDELSLDQTLIEIKVAKTKDVTTAATTTTTTRPKAKGVVVQEPSELRTTTSPSQASQLPQAKDKGKAILMVEPEIPLKKKDQVALDEEMARNLEA
ncbi:hypothetical protein Tco_1087080 [Tanacetum coccineum]